LPRFARRYGGNPLACAAGLAVAGEFSRRDILGNVVERGEQLKSGLQAIVDANPAVLSEVRGWGLLVGVEIKDSVPATAAQVVSKAMDKGLLLVPAGVKVVRFVPPLVVSEEEVGKALDMFRESVEELAKEMEK
jgi:acetylornithine aminotransferase